MIHEISDVVASSKVATCTRENYRSDREVPRRLIERSGKIAIHVPGEGIHFFGAIQADGQDTIGRGGCDVTH